MAHQNPTHRRRTSSAADPYLAPTSPRYSTMSAAPRPSMSSDRYSLNATLSVKQQGRSKRESDHRSIMSSRASETSQATRTSRVKRSSRPPPPPPPKITQYTSFTPAMTEEEDARSEMVAFKSKIRSGLSRIAKVFMPRMPKSSSSHHKGVSSTSVSSPNHSFESSEISSRYSRW